MTEQRNDQLTVTEEEVPNRGRRLSIKPPGGRRKSTFKQLASTTTNIANARRLTKALLAELPEDQSSKPKVRVENTYRMKPDEGTVFSPWKVKAAVEQVLDDQLRDVTYDKATCSKLCCDLSQHIRSRVKNMDFHRYKIISNVIIGQCSEQGLEIASRALWDAKTDNYTCVTYKNKSIFAIAMIHGLFFE